jgi:hypothetical protein
MLARADISVDIAALRAATLDPGSSEQDEFGGSRIMKRVRTLCFALIAAGCALPALADCTAPVAPSKVPDGASAPESEMVAAMQTLKRYDADVNTYVKCLEFEAKQNRLSKEEQARRHNAVMDSLTSVAAKFNEQVRVFKAKSG